MHIWTDRYLIFLGIFGVVLSVGIGYQYALTSTTSKKPLQVCSRPASFAKTSWQDTQLPQDIQLQSVIPNFRLAASRHFFLPVDLRRAELQLEIQPDSAITFKPILDKVLFVPKKFG